MTKPLFILVIFICLATVPVCAQIHLGATSAYNATFVLDKGLSEDPRYNSTYTYQLSPVGFNFGVDFGKKFGLQLESILSNQGQIYELVDVAGKVAGERKIDLQYINIPMMMKFMGGGDGKARTNFNFGPQLSLLSKAKETLQANAGTFAIPEGVDFAAIRQEFPAAVNNGDGTYDIPTTQSPKDLLTKEANDFRNAEFQLAMAFGFDLDLSKHLYLSAQVRANYSLTDMRNGDVIDALKAGNAGDIFGSRANLLVGVQMGLHWYFGTLRSFKDK
ncbi:MAG: outer membrane beta-barrel protein [Cyclobacteriaceae bacterium]|nr:outer membrane beta-barrel protein [Cyclobacteriaceae bacterium]